MEASGKRGRWAGGQGIHGVPEGGFTGCRGSLVLLARPRWSPEERRSRRFLCPPARAGPLRTLSRGGELGLPCLPLAAFWMAMTVLIVMSAKWVGRAVGRSGYSCAKVNGLSHNAFSPEIRLRTRLSAGFGYGWAKLAPLCLLQRPMLPFCPGLTTGPLS